MGRERKPEETRGEVSGTPLQNSLKASLWREKWVVCGWELNSTVGQASPLHHYVTLGRWVDFLRPQLVYLLNGKCEYEEFKGLLWVAQILTVVARFPHRPFAYLNTKPSMKLTSKPISWWGEVYSLDLGHPPLTKTREPHFTTEKLA